MRRRSYFGLLLTATLRTAVKVLSGFGANELSSARYPSDIGTFSSPYPEINLVSMVIC